jgi:hypothetical protein
MRPARCRLCLLRRHRRPCPTHHKRYTSLANDHICTASMRHWTSMCDMDGDGETRHAEPMVMESDRWGDHVHIRRTFHVARRFSARGRSQKRRSQKEGIRSRLHVPYSYPGIENLQKSVQNQIQIQVSSPHKRPHINLRVSTH